MNYTLTDLPNHIGKIFEEITKQYMRRLNNANNLPFLAKSFATCWGKDKKGNLQEVDIVIDSLVGKDMILGECKWRESINVNKVLESLEERAEYFDTYKVRTYLFIKYPVEITGKDVINVAIDEYFK